MEGSEGYTIGSLKGNEKMYQTIIKKLLSEVKDPKLTAEEKTFLVRKGVIPKE